MHVEGQSCAKMAEFIPSNTWTCSACSGMLIPPRNAKQLSCGHIVCQVCLAHHEGEGQTSLTCPSPRCEVVTVLPEGGSYELKTVHKHCERHKDCTVSMYCKKCKDFICKLCLFQVHGAHQNQIAGLEDFKEEQHAKLLMLSNDLGMKQEILKRYTQDESPVDKVVKECMRCVDACIEKHNGNIDANGRKMIAELKKKSKQQTDKISTQKAEVHGIIEEMKEAVESPNQDDGTARVTLQSLKDHLQKVESLMAQKLPNLPSTKDVCFLPTPAQDHVNIGELKQSDAPGAKAKRKLKKFKLVTIATIPKVFKQPISIAACQQGAFGVLDRDKNNQVHTFYRKNDSYKFGGEFELKDLETPSDMAMNAKGNFLVTKGKNVEVYSSAGQYQKQFTRCVPLPTVDAFGHKQSLSRRHSLKRNKAFAIDSISVSIDGVMVLGSKKNQSLTLIKPTGEETVKISVIPCYLATNGQKVAITDSINNQLCIMDIKSMKDTKIIAVESPHGLSFHPRTNTIFVVQDQKHNISSVIGQYTSNGDYLTEFSMDPNNGQAYDIAFVDVDTAVVLRDNLVEIFSVK